MDDNLPTVRLGGVRNPTVLDAYFSSGMVDIAYVVHVEGDRVDLLLDGTDVRKAEEREWITEILRDALVECGEAQAEIQFLVELHR